MSEKAVQLASLRSKKLPEKAQNLLGRSYRNPIFHSS
jgi:hypothetical protein